MKKTVRLDRLLANLGYGSRTMVGKMIRRGFFTLDGEAIRDAAAQVTLADMTPARARVEDQPLDPLWPLTIILHKPADYVCSHDEPGGGASVFELLPHRFHVREPALSIAGRLDKDSTGLVILTDDGPFLHKIISPKTDVPKKYRVHLDRPLKGNETALFAAGTLMLNGETKPLRPAEMEALDEHIAVITLHEGRYHQVRRMFAAAGNHVVSLHRLAIGGIDLTGLEEGQWRILSDEERAKIV
jgi:16S rRNA pseudouridine516 synthase